MSFGSTHQRQSATQQTSRPGGWRERAWNLPVWLLSLGAAIFISVCGFLVDHLIHKAERLLASDFYTLLIAFGFSYVLLSYEGRRRKMLRRRMEVAAEVNHHIRNALTGVVFTAAVQNDPALLEVLRDATDRIDWVLTEVLPDGSDDLRWPVQSPAWRPTGWESRRDAE